MKSLALVLILGATGCYEPDVGPALADHVDAGTDPGTDGGGGGGSVGCDNSDSDPSVAVSLATDVRPLMTRSPGGCMFCHSSRAVSGLDLSSYASIRRGGVNSGANHVIPFKPCDSILLKKLGRTPPFGSRMPFNGPPYYTAAEFTIVRDWIAEGAENN